MVDPARGLRRDVHAAARHHDRERRAAEDRDLTEGELLRYPVGDRCVCADAGVGPPDRGNAGRPARAAAPVLGWPGAVWVDLTAVCTFAERAVSDPRARWAGDRWCDHVRDRAFAVGPGIRGP